MDDIRMFQLCDKRVWTRVMAGMVVSLKTRFMLLMHRN